MGFADGYGPEHLDLDYKTVLQLQSLVSWRALPRPQEGIENGQMSLLSVLAADHVPAAQECVL